MPKTLREFVAASCDLLGFSTRPAEALSHDTVAREVPIALDLGLMAEASVHTLSDHAAPK
jgi:hypothetical protein